MTYPVTPDDITTELGRDLTQVEAQQVARWITQSALIIAKHFGTLDGLDPDLLGYAITAMVTTRLTRPADGATSVQVSIDDATSVRRYTDSAPGLILTDQLIDLLTPEVNASQAFTINPTGAPPA
ncbi:MAG: hypothetical protein LKI24_14160 [Acidipropionibacterium sp.]|jgi:hypothetical protein|nr:hypothetical protein [Acidipropionibacterium sp.]